MPKLFYLYAFVFLAHKLYLVFEQLFKKKKDDVIEIDLTSTNLSDTLNKVFSFSFLIFICNAIWLVAGFINGYERLLLSVIVIVDMILVATIFDKNDRAATDKKITFIALTIKIAVACLLIYKHVLHYQGI